MGLFNHKKETEKLNIGKILSQLESDAWYGGNTTAWLLTDKDFIELSGYTYEPTYECFSTAHSIRLNDELLFYKGSRNDRAYHYER